MKPKLVVFDIAGTTMDDKEDSVASAFMDAIKEVGIKLDDKDIRWVMGYRKIDAIRMLMDHHDINLDESGINAIHDRFIEILNDHYKKSFIREFAGITDLFSDLKSNGIKIALNTGFNRSTTDIIINKIGWDADNLIDASVTSDEVNLGRPYSDMILKLMEMTGVSNPEEVYKVGDTPSDLIEGKNAGCGKTIGVLYGTHTKDELEIYPHSELVENISELKKAILN